MVEHRYDGNNNLEIRNGSNPGQPYHNVRYRLELKEYWARTFGLDISEEEAGLYIEDLIQYFSLLMSWSQNACSEDQVSGSIVAA